PGGCRHPHLLRAAGGPRARAAGAPEPTPRRLCFPRTRLPLGGRRPRPLSSAALPEAGTDQFLQLQYGGPVPFRLAAPHSPRRFLMHRMLRRTLLQMPAALAAAAQTPGVGKIKTRASKSIAASPLSVGFETL